MGRARGERPWDVDVTAGPSCTARARPAWNPAEQTARARPHAYRAGPGEVRGRPAVRGYGVSTILPKTSPASIFR